MLLDQSLKSPKRKQLLKVYARLIQSTHRAATFCPWVDLCRRDLCHRDLDLYRQLGLVRRRAAKHSPAATAWRTSARRAVGDWHRRIYSRRAPGLLQAAATWSNTHPRSLCMPHRRVCQCCVPITSRSPLLEWVQEAHWGELANPGSSEE